MCRKKFHPEEIFNEIFFLQKKDCWKKNSPPQKICQKFFCQIKIVHKFSHKKSSAGKQNIFVWKKNFAKKNLPSKKCSKNFFYEKYNFGKKIFCQKLNFICFSSVLLRIGLFHLEQYTLYVYLNASRVCWSITSAQVNAPNSLF